MIGMDLAAREMLDVGGTLTDEQWHLASDAEGWSVKDVGGHAGCLMAFLVAAVGGTATFSWPTDMPSRFLEDLSRMRWSGA
jgi:hypothetical protein